MFRALFISAAIFASLPFAAEASDWPRVGSTSLCGDGYLTALAPSHIRALSWQSRSPLSRASQAQRALPQLWDDAETLAASNVDIILFGPGEGALAERLAVHSITLNWGEDFGAVFENAQRVAAALNTADTLSPALKTRLAQLETKRADKPKVLYISSSGASAGGGTFVNAVIEAAGGENIMQAQGWLNPDIEEIVTLSPDIILTSFTGGSYASVNEAGLRNRALSRFIAAHPTVEIDGALWPCAGPYLIEAAEQLAAKIEALP